MPLPVPSTPVVNVYITGLRVKVAVTDLFPSVVMEVGFVDPLRSPLQLVKLDPAAGLAVTVTTVPEV